MTMPRITVTSAIDGTNYSLATPDLSLIGPWLASVLPLCTSEPCHFAAIEVRPLWADTGDGRGRLDWPAQHMVRVLDAGGRRELVEDLAAVLGMRIAGDVVERRPDG